MKEKNFAILIPCYNAALFLPELFEGINAQTVPFNEIICYDDCSTDNTIEIATKLGAKVIKGLENKGPAFARNRLIESTICQWVHFHDADDMIDTRFLEIMSSYVTDEHTQLLCNTYVLDRNNRTFNLGNITYDSLATEPDQLKYFIDHVGFASMGLYSKKALQFINGFREDIKGNEDPDLHVRLVKNGFVIKNVSEYLVTKLEHEHSFSHQNWSRCLSDKLVCLQTYSTVLNSKYFPQLGEQAAALSNYFYRENDKILSKNARLFAYGMGIKSMHTSNFANLVTSVFGIRIYLWIYRRRIDLKKIFT